jgi:hypothetical protein
VSHAQKRYAGGTESRVVRSPQAGHSLPITMGIVTHWPGPPSAECFRRLIIGAFSPQALLATPDALFRYRGTSYLQDNRVRFARCGSTPREFVLVHAIYAGAVTAASGLGGDAPYGAISPTGATSRGGEPMQRKFRIPKVLCATLLRHMVQRWIAREGALVFPRMILA